MKDKYEGCYIDGYKDHYAVFADNGEKLAEYDTHKEAKEDIAEWEAEVKNESYIPADTLATGYRFTIHETELLENAIKKHVEQKVDQGVNAMFDTDSEEFKKVGNEPYDKSQWWDDMKLTMRIKKTPFPRKNGYTNGDFRPNQKWLMGAIECCKSARDCEYLLKDAYLSVAHDKKLIQNLKAVRDGNPSKYVKVKVVQKWLDNGVTPEKVEKHIEWFKANYIKGLQAKKKEFNKTQNETATEEPINELGIFTAINIGFWGFVGICCIVSGILDKKHGKEIKANLTDAEFKAIKNDTITVAKNLIAAQKSSPFYNSIYKHNWITQDTYKDMINAFNKGDLCSSTVRFFDAENFENYKSYYKEYGEWGDYNPNWEKLEKSVNADMVKIIESLGFDIKTGKSPKYPNCEVRVADGEVVYVYPKAPDDILERGKKSKKKLNEDHSEISNDPEMEELMALAGVTTADLDDLENDNDLDLDDDDPIDANTLREIDAAMDESVKSALEHIETADKAIDKNIEQIEKFIPCANKFLDVILRDTIIEVPDPELSKLTPKQRDLAIKLCKISERFKKDCHNFDYDRGSSEELSYWSKNWIGYRYSTILDKFSYSNKKVSPAQIAFFKKCAEGGEYDKRLKKCVDEFNKIAHRVKTYQAKAAKEEDKREDGASCYNLYLLDEYFIPEYRYFSGQIHYTSGDIQGGLKYSGRTRTSFFGKRVRDSINESVGGVIAISVAGLIGGAAIVNAITERKLKAEAKELTKAEFDKLINDMVSINEAVISKLKTSKWWKFIYEPCMNRKNSPDIHNQASKYKQEFMSGKCIGPSFHSSFVDIDDPDPKIYTKLDAEIGRSPDDEAWEKAFDSAYYESQKLIKEAVKKLGFNDEGKSTKYPDIKIDIGSGEYIGIWIEPIYNGYYKLKDSKKSQNESVNTDLDILLAESAEFLFDE